MTGEESVYGGGADC